MIRPSLLLAALAALVQAPVLLQGQAASPFPSDPPMSCDSCAEWNAPRQPFKVFGNTYFVGSAGLSSILVTSEAGHVLIDVALPQSAPMIDANIRALGFKTSDIGLILTSHAHYDHVGGVRSMQRYTGATVVASGRTAEALSMGHPTPDDPQFGGGDFPAVASGVKVVNDGEVVRLGPIAVTAHYTPGHTPGATSWTWRSCEGSRCLSIAYVDSLTAVSNDGFRFTGDATHPSLVDSFRHSLDLVRALPCDILLTTHPSASGMDEKLRARGAGATADPFVDPFACRALADVSQAGLDARVRQEGARP